MPIHYDPARIKKRFCPQGHDKYVVGVMSKGRQRVCYSCYQLHTTHGWRNAKNAIRQIRLRLKSAIAIKRKKIAELEKELTNYAAQE